MPVLFAVRRCCGRLGGLGKTASGERDGLAAQVAPDGSAAELGRGDERGAAAAAGIKDDSAGGAAGLDQLAKEGQGLLGGVASALGGHVVEAGDIEDVGGFF